MSAVFSHQQLAVVTQIRSLLENRGIATELRNEYASGAAGELAPIETWPQLWVRRESDRQTALDIIENFQQQESGPEWRCTHCGSFSPQTFDWCWHCGAGR